MANATTLSGRSGIQINLDSSKVDAAKIAAALDKLNINYGIDWAYGTAVNQVNLLYHAILTATTGQATVDISGSAIQDAFGDDCDFSALKLVFIKNTHATVPLILGGDTNEINLLTDASDEIIIAPGGFFLWINPTAAGLDVSGADKNLTIQGSGASVTYEIILMGLQT